MYLQQTLPVGIYSDCIVLLCSLCVWENPHFVHKAFVYLHIIIGIYFLLDRLAGLLFVFLFVIDFFRTFWNK